MTKKLRTHEDEPLQTVAFTLERLAMWLHHQTPSRVNTTEITTLYGLQTNGPMRISDLAELEVMSQPGMTALVDRLEKLGHARRTASPSDRRVTLVEITDLGTKVLSKRWDDRSAALHPLLEKLDQANRELLIAAVPAILQMVDKHNDERPR